MGRRLALLAEGSHESPWTRASGSESMARVKGLGEGEKAWLKVELRPEGELLLCLAEGPTSLQPFNPSEWLRYKAGKIASTAKSMTSVEVFFG